MTDVRDIIIYRQTDRGRVEVLRWGSLTLAPIIIYVKNTKLLLVECCALWGERERSGRLYCRHACHIVAEQHKQDEAVSGALFCDFVAS